MDYAPFQRWVQQNVNLPAGLARGASKLTAYDPVLSGNVVPGEVPITDPGQLGRANLPSWHTSRQVRDDHLDPVLPAAEALGTELPRLARFTWLRGTSYIPWLRTGYDQMPNDSAPVPSALGGNPFSIQGADHFPGELSEHGPITAKELDQPRGTVTKTKHQRQSFWRTVAMLPPQKLDPLASTDERVVKAVGQEQKDTDRMSDSAVGTGNTFIIPDIRRTWDQPKDAPPDIPRDAYGVPMYDKAGYQWMPKALEPIPERVEDSHTFPQNMTMTELPVGNTQARVRAGVQYDWRATRPPVMPHHWYYRGFDQLIAQGTRAQKGMLHPPSISRPVMSTDEPQSDVRWSAGQRFAFPPAGMEALGVRPNINRENPQPWDASLFTTVPQSVDTRVASLRLS